MKAPAEIIRIVPLRCDLTHSAWNAGTVAVVNPLPALVNQSSCRPLFRTECGNTKTSDGASSNELAKTIR